MNQSAAESVKETVVYRVCLEPGCPARTSVMGLPSSLKDTPGGGEHCPRCGGKLTDVSYKEYRAYTRGGAA